MARMSVARAGVLAVVGLLLLAPAGWAQEAGIAGVIKDNTGAVLPGVTVTVTSPVLIEKERVVITDAEGRYSVTQLRPGVYSVTFTLTGFTTVVREDLRLSAGFTATIDVEMRVGGLAETITVSGASPVVDLENVRRQQVVTSDLLESLPMSTKSIASMANLTTGVSGLGTVGGGYQIEPGADEISGGGSFHGKAGTKVSFDGMVIENSSGNSSYQLNAAAVEEMVMSTSGISADTNADGLVVNVIPKDGSNTFRTILAGTYSNSSMEGHNLSPDLIARGLLTGPKTLKLFDESVSLGGPIKRDRLWFFVAPRSWGFAKESAGTFWNKTQDVYLTPPDAALKVVKFTPWVDRPEDRNSGRLEWYQSVLSRVTWQAGKKNKFGLTYDEQRGCNCYSLSSNTSQEAFVGSYYFDPNRLVQGTWSSPITNKLLLEAGAAATISTWDMFYHPGVRNDVVNVYDLGTGIQYGSAAEYLGHPNARNRFTQRASMSYVTGGHNFKTGFLVDEARTDTYWHVNGNVNYLFYNGAPLLIAQWSTPYEEKANIKAELGIYAQDQWKVTNKVTLNLGLRWDYFNSYVPPQTSGAAGETDGYWVGSPTVNPWLGPRNFAPIYDVPSWKDWNPRFGAAYDLFGDGKTALKFSVGRYVVKMSTDEFAGGLANPINRSVNYALRSWTDTNGNYVPDCNLGNFAANGECGPLLSPLGATVNTTNFDPAVLTGYGKRDSNWDVSTEFSTSSVGAWDSAPAITTTTAGTRGLTPTTRTPSTARSG